MIPHQIHNFRKKARDVWDPSQKRDAVFSGNLFGNTFLKYFLTFFTKWRSKNAKLPHNVMIISEDNYKFLLTSIKKIIEKNYFSDTK